MRTRKIEFIEEGGKTYKVETDKMEIELKEVPSQIQWIQSQIDNHNSEILKLEDTLKQLNKLIN